MPFKKKKRQELCLSLPCEDAGEDGVLQIRNHILTRHWVCWHLIVDFQPLELQKYISVVEATSLWYCVIAA